jgi:hypothetical protein
VFGFVEILGSVRRFSEKEERLWVKSCYGFGGCSRGKRRKMWWPDSESSGHVEENNKGGMLQQLISFEIVYE